MVFTMEWIHLAESSNSIIQNDIALCNERSLHVPKRKNRGNFDTYMFPLCLNKIDIKPQTNRHYISSFKYD